MKISIVTVVYNNEKYIAGAIKSVLSQNYPDIEYIIVDGGSNDGTMEIINTYSEKIDIIISERDNGIYDAMNKGIYNATGEIVGILNSDDCYSHEYVISNVVNQIKNTESDALYGDLVYVDKITGKIVRRWVSGTYKKGLFKYGWMPPHPTFFVRKEVYERYGNYNTLFKSSADYELMLRFIHKYNISVTYLPHVLVKMRTGGVSNISFKNRIRANKEDRLAWKINNLNQAFYTTWLKPMRKIAQKFF